MTIELDQSNLAEILKRDFAGTIGIEGEYEHIITVHIPMGQSTAETVYNELMQLPNDKGVTRRILQEIVKDIDGAERKKINAEISKLLGRVASLELDLLGLS